MGSRMVVFVWPFAVSLFTCYNQRPNFDSGTTKMGLCHLKCTFCPFFYKMTLCKFSYKRPLLI